MPFSPKKQLNTRERRIFFGEGKMQWNNIRESA